MAAVGFAVGGVDCDGDAADGDRAAAEVATGDGDDDGGYGYVLKANAKWTDA